MSYDPAFLALAMTTAAVGGYALGRLSRIWSYVDQIEELEGEVQFAHNEVLIAEGENLTLAAEIGALAAEVELYRSVAGVNWAFIDRWEAS